MTFSVTDDIGILEYFTISLGALYNDLTVPSASIGAQTTRDEIDIAVNASGGVKFKDISGDARDADYIYYAEGLPYGLAMYPDGHIRGRIVGKQTGGTITVTVQDALGTTKSNTIDFGDIYYWPYINQSSSFDVGYLEVGEVYTTKDVTEYLRPYLIDLTDGNLVVKEIIPIANISERDLGKKISRVVLMGIGEPLDNYDNLINFRWGSEPQGKIKREFNIERIAN